MFFTPDFIDPLVVNHPLTTKLHKQPYQICKKTVMDTSDPLIEFDEEGICSYYNENKKWFSDIQAKLNYNSENLNKIVLKIKNENIGNQYDCIMGLSGGVDSSYMCYYVTKVLGLRALVVHVDTGWNSELAVNNIQNIVEKLNLDLHTLVIDWEEMRDLQLAYFKSGIANLDVPQDHCFIASLYQEALKYNIRYIFNGGNMSTESILPSSWGYDANDYRNLKSIHKKYGSIKLKTYPKLKLFDHLIKIPYLKRMKVIRPLEYIDYNKSEVKSFLISELGWRDYGGKHYESKFTKFFQAHYLPTKFGFDKRKAHLSSLIVSGQITREDAINELKKPLYDKIELNDDIDYFIKKIGISMDEYIEIMNNEPSFYSDFPNNQKLYNRIRRVLKIIKKIKLLVR